MQRSISATRKRDSKGAYYRFEDADAGVIVITEPASVKATRKANDRHMSLTDVGLELIDGAIGMLECDSAQKGYI